MNGGTQMNKDLVDGMAQLNKVSLESVKRLGEINGRMLQRLGEQQLEVANEYVSGSVKQMEKLGSVEGVQDMFANQARLVADWNDKAMAYAKETAKIVSEARDEFQVWAEQSLKDAQSAASQKATRPVSKKVA